MNTPDPHGSTVSVAPWMAARDCPTGNTPRLVVVVSAVPEEAALAGLILAQVRAAGQPVLLLGVAASPEAEDQLRRSLVTVEAFVAANGHPVEVKSESGRAWLERIQSECGPSDQVACYAEDGVGMWREPLSDVLSRTLQVPVHDFSALRSEPTRRRPSLSRVGAWLGSLGLIGGFLLLQARIVLAVQDWMQSVLLVITMLMEVALIWFWNSMLG